MAYKVPVCSSCGAELGRYCYIGNKKVCIICYERWLHNGDTAIKVPTGDKQSRQGAK